MQNATQIVAVVGLLAVVGWYSKQIFAIVRDQAAGHGAALSQQAEMFAKAVGAIADATAKAVQSITYPEAVGQVATGDLPEPRQAPVLERLRDLDYTDPTDVNLPESFREDAAMLGDDVNGPMGVPGLVVDPARYDVT